MARENILGLTVKYPEPGMVKTRLARDIGDIAASRVCRSMAERIIAETRPDDMDYERIIFYSPEDSEKLFRAWLPGERMTPQKGADIGGIMDNAFCRIFRAGAEKAIVVGADIPGLDRQVVNRAFGELEQFDVVIGPALDGGYYLVGLKSPLPDIFRGLPWGTADVFSKTLIVIAELGLSVKTVSPMTDVDTVEDLLKVRNLYPGYFDGL